MLGSNQYCRRNMRPVDALVCQEISVGAALAVLDDLARFLVLRPAPRVVAEAGHLDRLAGVVAPEHSPVLAGHPGRPYLPDRPAGVADPEHTLADEPLAIGRVDPDEAGADLAEVADDPDASDVAPVAFVGDQL